MGEARQMGESSGRVGQGGSICARPAAGSAEQTACNRQRMADEGRISIARLGQAVNGITIATRILHTGTVDNGIGNWRVYRVIRPRGQMWVVDAMVEGRLRLDGPEGRSLGRTMAQVRALGLGLLVEGLARGWLLRNFGHW